MDEMNVWMSGEVLWVKIFDRILVTYIIIDKVYLLHALIDFQLITAGRKPIL